MLFNIFSREERFLRGRSKRFNPTLISRLEGRVNEIEIYAAIKATIQDEAVRSLGESQKEAAKALYGVSLNEVLERIKAEGKKDPKSTFFMLVEIHARLLTKEEFEELFRGLLKLTTQLMDVIIFKNPNLNLQYRGVK